MYKTKPTNFICTLLLTFAKSGQLCQNSGLSNGAAAAGRSLDRTCSTMSNSTKKFSDWAFNEVNELEKFPLDPVKKNFIRRFVPKSVFSRVDAKPLETELKLVAASADVMQNILDLDPDEADNEDFIKLVAGNTLAKNSKPMAHRYGGHQFGYWAGQLGDGRAHILGEYTNRKGERWELQLKGSGQTPYSRGGDGRAVLRSSLREFLCSEAMNALGIPTSRAGALVVSNDPIIRDQFYSGKVELERAAVVLRLAPSWFRIGSLEICAKHQEDDILTQITDFVISKFYPHIEGPGKYFQFFRTVFSESTALVAKWMAVGFAHGVLNTDNLSLLSITIDYGPFGFLDEYDSYFIPNHSDDEGRYSYVNQPHIFKWNLEGLASALSVLFTEEERQEAAKLVRSFNSVYEEQFMDCFGRKLGFHGAFDKRERLVYMLLDIMESQRMDFTQTFRQLGKINLSEEDLATQWALIPLSKHRNCAEFLDLYRTCLQQENITEDARKSRMSQVNPQYVLRNWMAEAAIRQANLNDFELARFLLKILSNPFVEDEEAEKMGFSKQPPSWSKKLKVSCSS